VVGIVPQNSGISVVFSGAEHWLRVYGLSSHPNVLGGHLAVGVILILGRVIIAQGRQRFWLIAAWLLCWLTLLLTFSRSAWLGVAGGGLLAVTLLLRGGHLARSRFKLLVALAAAGLGLTAIFVWRFLPFLVNRIEVAIVSYETQAIVQRLDAARLAVKIFIEHPVTGVGLAQSVFVTRNLLGTPIDWIHNVPLLIAAELGVGGIALIGLLLFALGAIGLRRWRTRSISMWQALVGGALIALLIAMQFDHYVWTTPQGGLLWAWLVGWWLRRAHAAAADHTTAS
jgi:O-antigen ligase